jgi:hypothetical protein
MNASAPQKTITSDMSIKRLMHPVFKALLITKS